jgi:hypothetical protein
VRLPEVTMVRILGSIAWLAHVVAEIWRQWHSNERCMRCLAALDDDDTHHLSETGQKLRREARRQLQAL